MTDQQLDQRFDIVFNGVGNWLWKAHPAPPPIVEDVIRGLRPKRAWADDLTVMQALTGRPPVSRLELRALTQLSPQLLTCAMHRLMRARKIQRAESRGRVVTYQRTPLETQRP